MSNFLLCVSLSSRDLHSFPTRRSSDLLEEGHPLLGYVDGAAGFRITSLARIPVADTEAAEATKLDFVALGQRVGDVVEDRVDDGLSLFFRQVGELGDLVDQLGFCHLALRVTTLARRFRECQLL